MRSSKPSTDLDLGDRYRYLNAIGALSQWRRGKWALSHKEDELRVGISVVGDPDERERALLPSALFNADEESTITDSE
jgi:hypothetical protein